MSSWDDLMSQIEYPRWTTPRYQALDRLDRTLRGTLYSHLPWPFHMETEPNTQVYIKLNERQPSVIYKLASSIVEDTADKLFSGRHWPHLQSKNESLVDDIEELTRKTNLEDTMKAAVFTGSIGSVAITFKIVDNILSFDHWSSKNCLPVFGPNGELESLTVFFLAPIDSLLALGYTIPDKKRQRNTLWWAKKFTKTEEIAYVPQDSTNPPEFSEWPVDDSRSTAHNLGFVPGVWIPNLPGGVFPDGACTFENILDITVEIDYQLSQAGRGFKYSASPQLAVRGLEGIEQNNGKTVVRSPANIIELNPGDDVTKPGDAKLLEMQGQGLRATMEFVKLIRGLALETAKGSRKDPEKLTAIPMSGKAMETLEEELLDLIQALRRSYGDRGLLKLIKLVMKACGDLGLVNSYSDKELDDLQLHWPKVFMPSAAEIQEYATALLQAVQGAFIAPDNAEMLFQIFLDLPHPIPTPNFAEGAQKVDPALVFGQKIPKPPQTKEPDGSSE